MSQRASITCPARLHLGLWEIAPDQPGRFGGIGWMIDEPSTQLELEWSLTERSNASSTAGWETVGPAEATTRMDRVIQGMAQASAARAAWSRVRLRCSVLRTAPPHRGLGSGTQLACSVATLVRWMERAWEGDDLASARWAADVWSHATQPMLAARDALAHASQRGERSGLGTAGHLAGGFMVDHGCDGHAPQSPRRIERFEMPTSWRMVMIAPQGMPTVSGSLERAYFQTCQSPNPHRLSMQRMVDEAIVPALVRGDLNAFGEGIYEYGRRAGQVFAAAQGGAYRSPVVEQMVAQLRRWGVQGVAQSSWGPSLVAVVVDQAAAETLVQRLDTEAKAPHTSWIAKPSAAGATLQPQSV